MDRFTLRHDEDPRNVDLASIVLADERARRKHARRGRTSGAFLTRSGLREGYDARSVLVLALVVAALAAVVGWTTTAGRGDTGVPSATKGVSHDAAPAATHSASPKASTPVAPVAKRGVQLAVAQITTARSSAGGGVIRVTVANRGTVDGDVGVGTQLVVVLDGAVVGERSLGGVPAGETATTELGLDTCPSGRHELAVIVDPRGAIREADEGDNARTSVASFGC